MPEIAWAPLLDKLVSGADLSEAEATAAMRAMMTGDATPGQIGAFLVALRAKGETSGEVAAMARVMRELSLKVAVDEPLVDTCGTGGDGSGSVNLSTMAALVVAGAGIKVAKHGNRAASSRCGSADVLEALGVEIDLPPEGVAACIEEAGIGFCFAPRFHPAMRFVGPVRRELGIRTTFNLLGPLTNPAGARRQVVGVADPGVAALMADALAALGTEHAVLVHGFDGLDEISTAGPARTWTVRDGTVLEGTIDPATLGFAAAPTSSLGGGDAEANAAAVNDVLAGVNGPIRDAVLLNAGLALMVAGQAGSLGDGCDQAGAAIDGGAAADTLARFRDVSRAHANP
jgi:anthranilate phosphoribosyltransferase